LLDLIKDINLPDVYISQATTLLENLKNPNRSASAFEMQVRNISSSGLVTLTTSQSMFTPASLSLLNYSDIFSIQLHSAKDDKTLQGINTNSHHRKRLLSEAEFTW
jgi:hypothetical protein